MCVNIPRRTEQCVIVGGHIPQDGVVELQAVLAEAVICAVVQLLIGREQIHHRVKGRSIPAAPVAQPGFQPLHALPVDRGKEQRTGEAADSRMQAGVHVGIAGK